MAKLRAAGAVLLGKANLSEFANFLTNGMPSGYSLARRPGAEPVQRGHHAERLVAAAPARSRPPAWRRSRSAPRPRGSIVSPSAAQGIVGLRPDDRPRQPHRHRPDRATQDTAGPMTRTVADAAAELRRDRRQGPGGPGHRLGARRPSRTTSRALARPRWPASGSASSTTPTPSTSRRSPRSRRSARRRSRSPTPQLRRRRSTSSRRSSSATSTRTWRGCPRARR